MARIKLKEGVAVRGHNFEVEDASTSEVRDGKLVTVKEKGTKHVRKLEKGQVVEARAEGDSQLYRNRRGELVRVTREQASQEALKAAQDAQKAAEAKAVQEQERTSQAVQAAQEQARRQQELYNQGYYYDFGTGKQVRRKEDVRGDRILPGADSGSRFIGPGDLESHRANKTPLQETRTDLSQEVKVPWGTKPVSKVGPDTTKKSKNPVDVLRRFSAKQEQKSLTDEKTGSLRRAGATTSGLVSGALSIFLKPVETVKGMFYSVTHPKKAAASLRQSFRTQPYSTTGEIAGGLVAGKVVGKGAGVVKAKLQSPKVLEAGVASTVRTRSGAGVFLDETSQVSLVKVGPREYVVAGRAKGVTRPDVEGSLIGSETVLFKVSEVKGSRVVPRGEVVSKSVTKTYPKGKGSVSQTDTLIEGWHGKTRSRTYVGTAAEGDVSKSLLSTIKSKKADFGVFQPKGKESVSAVVTRKVASRQVGDFSQELLFSQSINEQAAILHNKGLLASIKVGRVRVKSLDSVSPTKTVEQALAPPSKTLEAPAKQAVAALTKQKATARPVVLTALEEVPDPAQSPYAAQNMVGDVKIDLSRSAVSTAPPALKPLEVTTTGEVSSSTLMPEPISSSTAEEPTYNVQVVGGASLVQEEEDKLVVEDLTVADLSASPPTAPMQQSLPKPPVPVKVPITRPSPKPPIVKSVFGSSGGIQAQQRSFDVFARVKGVFQKLNFSPITSQASASTLMESFVKGQPAATGKVTLLGSKKGLDLGRLFPGLTKKKGKDGVVYVEPKEKRIKSPGELEGITYKGIAASKKKRQKGGIKWV